METKCNENKIVLCQILKKQTDPTMNPNIKTVKLNAYVSETGILCQNPDLSLL